MGCNLGHSLCNYTDLRPVYLYLCRERGVHLNDTDLRPVYLCVSVENEASIFDLATSGGAAPVGGFIYRGCQSRRLYGSYVFGDKNG